MGIEMELLYIVAAQPPGFRRDPSVPSLPHPPWRGGNALRLSYFAAGSIELIVRAPKLQALNSGDVAELLRGNPFGILGRLGLSLNPAPGMGGMIP